MASRSSTTKHSEELRQRRNRHRDNRDTPARSGLNNPGRGRRFASRSASDMPPVLVRGGLDGIPLKAHKNRVPRRRYDVALNVPGAEVRLPSMPAMHLSWRLASGFLVLLLVFALYTMWTSADFTIQEIQVEGLQRLTTGDLYAVLGVAGESVIKANPELIRQDLLAAFPELATVEVKISLPAEVNIVTVERQPVLSWIQDGREMWVDPEGIAFPPRGNPGELVRVEANAAPQSLAMSSLAEAMGEASPASSSALLSAEMVETILQLGNAVPTETLLLYDDEHGFGWSDPYGWQVYFGMGTEEMNSKLLVYQAIVEHLVEDGVQPALVSVEHLHAPYYRMEQ